MLTFTLPMEIESLRIVPVEAELAEIVASSLTFDSTTLKVSGASTVGSALTSTVTSCVKGPAGENVSVPLVAL